MRDLQQAGIVVGGDEIVVAARVGVSGARFALQVGLDSRVDRNYSLGSAGMEVHCGHIDKGDLLILGVEVVVHQRTPGLDVVRTMTDVLLLLIVIDVVVHIQVGGSQIGGVGGMVYAFRRAAGTGHVNQIVIEIEVIVTCIGDIQCIPCSGSVHIECVMTPIHIAHISVIESVTGTCITGKYP